MNALANPEVGKYFEKYFVTSFQRVGTFKIVQTPNGPKQKQGGNVATYFCAPDGRVLHAVALLRVDRRGTRRNGDGTFN